MNNFNYFFTPVGSGYKKKFARNVGIAVLILFAFYGVMNLFLDTNYVVESESKITDSLTIPNAERDAKLAAGYKLYPGVGWVHSDDFGDQKPIYKTHPDNPSELILDIDAMLQYQKVLDSCNATGIQPSIGYMYSNDTHIITNSSCEWQTMEEYENEN
ncbi:hypothetical protein [Nitrosopumilus maritimus]|uniref:hypothetical protein n=1 Tax=Nitrosopumilus maritimus TaxID=338192 RepID=UPI000159B647|nr:hypothetical protein [Nitrosopumilus maritimus]